MSRRRVLAGLAATPLLPWVLAGCLATNDEASTGHPALAAPRGRAMVATVSLRRGDAVAMLRAVVDRGRELNRSAAVNITLGLGSSVFDVLGLEERRPPGLSVMPSFPGDVLTPDRSNSDLLIQVEADDAARVRTTFERLTADLKGLVVTWVASGRRPENRVDEGRALTRNPFGFTEGLANPAARGTPSPEDTTLIRTGEAPAWAVGGSYLAARVIQLAQELWDKDPIETQEKIIGRRRDGAWLDGMDVSGEPDFTADPDGSVTPLDSHVRRAHPRDGRPGPPLLRRSWTYTGSGAADPTDAGILFMCYQRNLKDGFEAVQRRLDGQALDLYLLTVGGGYFLVPPTGEPHWEDALLAP